MCKPAAIWYNCNHFTYTTIECDSKLEPGHCVRAPATYMMTRPCRLCKQQATESVKQAKRVYLNVRELEVILDTELWMPGFMDSVAWFYFRGEHKQYCESYHENAEDIGIEAHVQPPEQMEKKTEGQQEGSGSVALPIRRRLSEEEQGEAFDLALQGLAEIPSNNTALNGNGPLVRTPDTGIGSLGDDNDNGALFDTMSSSSSPVRPTAASSIASAEYAQRSSPNLVSPNPLSASSTNSQHLSPTSAELSPQHMFGLGNLHQQSTPPRGLGIDTLAVAHSGNLSTPTQTTPGVTTGQVIYPSPIPVASWTPQRFSHNPHSPSKPMGQPVMPAPAQPESPTPTGKKRSFNAISSSSQPAPLAPHTQIAPLEPGMSITFDTKRFNTPTKPKSRGKKGPASGGAKKSIRVITDLPGDANRSQGLTLAPTPISTPTSASVLAPAPPSAPTSISDTLPRDTFEEMILQCRKIREAAERRREEEERM